jgi:tubulin polyglutamylase TTLL1
LLGDKKFDMRTYVLVTSYRPLKVWRYNKGFCRFCFENYQHLTKSVENPEEVLYAHLTNVSFQKNSDKYNNVHGGKWQLETFRTYLELNFGLDTANDLFRQFDNIYLASLKSVQNCFSGDQHCFELYGYDIMIDDNFKAWLIEVNASPSLSTTTKEDKKMKKSLINDLLNIVMPSDWLTNSKKIGASTCKDTKIGFFDLIYDESRDPRAPKYAHRAKKGLNKKPFRNYF